MVETRRRRKFSVKRASDERMILVVGDPLHTVGSSRIDDSSEGLTGQATKQFCSQREYEVRVI